ncbi:ROK family protein [Pseudarthrobacter sp. NS4]|uniref:ROK family protein n=1 Tax=Pseudarthrobacter sp. NS4 TaxID=2973976 RepID=UPI00216372BC|nr:ROK family protein [Pseudarthrobacter sp. NS4]
MVMPVPAAAPTETAAPGSMGDVRRSNLALVLGKIAKAPADRHLTRAQVAAATGLTKASVSSLVLELLEAGVVREIGLNPQGERGRPGVGLELNPHRAVMGMEINVDYIAAGVTDLSGALLLQETLERDNRDSSSGPVMAALALLAAKVSGAAGERGVQIVGGGLAVPGLVDAAAARVITAPNLGWTDVDLDLAGLLPGAALGVSLFNEANAAALAELRHRSSGGSDFLFVSGEVGVGGGLVIGAELFTGPEGHAGEVGHVVVDPDGSPCSCGGTGCLETLAGQDAIFAAAGITDRGTRSANMSALVHSLAAGEPGALLAVDRAGRYLGVALASAARVSNINSVVLGGHFAVLDRWLRVPLLAGLEKYAPGRIAPEQVSLSAVGQAGALLGAAGSVVRSLVEAPYLLQS